MNKFLKIFFDLHDEIEYPQKYPQIEFEEFIPIGTEHEEGDQEQITLVE